MATEVLDDLAQQLANADYYTFQHQGHMKHLF